MMKQNVLPDNGEVMGQIYEKVNRSFHGWVTITRERGFYGWVTKMKMQLLYGWVTATMNQLLPSHVKAMQKQAHFPPERCIPITSH
jgi:hypothetical protein